MPVPSKTKLFKTQISISSWPSRYLCGKIWFLPYWRLFFGISWFRLSLAKSQISVPEFIQPVYSCESFILWKLSWIPFPSPTSNANRLISVHVIPKNILAKRRILLASSVPRDAVSSGFLPKRGMLPDFILSLGDVNAMLNCATTLTLHPLLLLLQILALSI